MDGNDLMLNQGIFNFRGIQLSGQGEETMNYEVKLMLAM